MHNEYFSRSFQKTNTKLSQSCAILVLWGRVASARGVRRRQSNRLDSTRAGADTCPKKGCELDVSKGYKYGFDYYLFKLYNFNDKEQALRNYIAYMLNRTQMIFEYEGLPDTIPTKFLELLLQINGYACIAEDNGKLYAFYGGLGGEPDEYYQPTICVVANPALKLSKTFKIGEDCVLGRNDTLMYGLTSLFRRYATAMVENDISFRMASINARVNSLISAPDTQTKSAADQYLSDLENGKIGCIAANEFLEGIKVQPMTSSLRTFTDLIEYQQYIKASWFNEIGLNANYNMKREKLSTTESQMNNDALLPLVDQMLRCRQEMCDQINEMFGTKISVSFGSSWEQLAAEMQAMTEGDVQLIGQEGEDDVVSENAGVSDGLEVSESSGGEELRQDDDAGMVDEAGSGNGKELSDTEEVSDTDAGVAVDVDVEVNVGEEANDDEQDERPTDDNEDVRDNDTDE